MWGLMLAAVLWVGSSITEESATIPNGHLVAVRRDGVARRGSGRGEQDLLLRRAADGDDGRGDWRFDECRRRAHQVDQRARVVVPPAEVGGTERARQRRLPRLAYKRNDTDSFISKPQRYAVAAPDRAQRQRRHDVGAPRRGPQAPLLLSVDRSRDPFRDVQVHQRRHGGGGLGQEVGFTSVADYWRIRIWRLSTRRATHPRRWSR